MLHGVRGRHLRLRRDRLRPAVPDGLHNVFVGGVSRSAGRTNAARWGAGTAGYAGFFIRLCHSALRSLQSTDRKNTTKRLSIVQYNLLPHYIQTAI